MCGDLGVWTFFSCPLGEALLDRSLGGQGAQDPWCSIVCLGLPVTRSNSRLFLWLLKVVVTNSWLWMYSAQPACEPVCVWVLGCH